MISVLTLTVVMFAKFSNVSTLRLTSTEAEPNLSPCLKKAAEEMKKKLDQDTKAYTIQGTCHAYSGVNMLLEGNASHPVSFLHCNQFHYDETAKILTVEPGVRYLDILPTLRKKHVFLTHGNYAGQTIIGLLSTGTHGGGVHCPHNFIIELLAINGLGKIKVVKRGDEEFSAWQLGIGVLGVVLQVKLGVLAEYHMENTNYPLQAVSEGVAFMSRAVSNGSQFSLLTCFNVTGLTMTADCVASVRTWSPKPLTEPFDKEDGHGCCASFKNTGPSTYGVISSVDGDLYSGANPEPKEASSRNCEVMENKMSLFVGAVLADKNPHLPAKRGAKVDWENQVYGYEVELGVPDLPKLQAYLPTFAADFSSPLSIVHLRYTHQDFLPPLLSPYKYSEMFNLEIYIAETLSDVEREHFFTTFEKMNTILRLEGANFRIHMGKGAIGNSFGQKDVGDNHPAVPVWDMQMFNFWKLKNDPNNRFTNQKWEVYRSVYGLMRY